MCVKSHPPRFSPTVSSTYGESDIIQTLNLSYYPTERGPYNLDASDIDDNALLLNPRKRWGGVMRRARQYQFRAGKYWYVQFWLMNPFLDPDNPNYDGGDMYINFGEISEDILKGRNEVLRKRNPLRP